MAPEYQRSTNVLRYAGRTILTVCSLAFIATVLAAISQSRFDALAIGTGLLLIGLLASASMNVVATMAEDLRAIRERLDDSTNPHSTPGRGCL